MTQDEIIEMACQVFGGLIKKEERDNFIAFANLVAAKEREECAKVLDAMADQMVEDMEPSTAIAWVRSKAAEIRARRNT